MRPEDLTPPFAWNDAKTIICDRIWYVTEHSEFVFPGWSDALLFGNDYPVCVEYCSGNGAWIANRAQLNPHLNWIAVEKKFTRVRKIWSKIKNLKLNNLIALCGEAHHATHSYFPSGTIKEIYINFPDPWPKRRHSHNRLIQPAFAGELHRVMEPRALLTFITDDVPYSNWFLSVLSAQGMFTSVYEAPFYSTQNIDYGSSYFEQLWRSKERTIRYHQFEK